MSEERTEYSALGEEALWILSRADGFLDLRLPSRARAELDRLAPHERVATPARRLALRLAMEEQHWPEAVRIARELVLRDPAQPDVLVLLAYATRRAEGLEAAEFILEEARRRFPDVAVISFNLACYACQSGRHERAMEHLRRAIKLDRHYAAAALEDEDLKPIWDRIEQEI